ncbi:MAG: CinA family nicotinamide mononucleotide deamidase-related protein [Dehalococcoidales bacterium]|nr:CinA family nicotinamide mononucleotide deamidase-related protein [Dehalococcoidales bacterium]
MSTPIPAELLSVGTELLRGEIVDTNAGYIAAQLPLLGIELQRMSTCGDNLDYLRDVLQQALGRATVVITSGGLGPTEDDLTREAIAATLGETLTIDPELEKNLRMMFSRSGREMPPHNIKQAMVIPSAKALPNPRGTAPGWWVEKNGKVIVTLPGPPREMTTMWQNEVIPRLKARFPMKPILARTVKTFFVAEATVAQLMEPFFSIDNPTLGIYAKPDGIQVRLIAHGDNAKELLDESEQKIRNLLSAYVWGKDDDTLAGLVGKWLINKNLTLATIEDMTGGLLADAITSTAESRNYYHGGLIATNDHAKISGGVPVEIIGKHGAVSAEVAEAMAVTVRTSLATDIGVSVTGITGAESKQPGLVFIGIADSHGSKTWQQQYQVGRADTRERVAIAALFRLRERLIELKLDV